MTRAQIRALANVCLRLEWVAARCGESGGEDGERCVDVEVGDGDGEWAVEGVEEGDRSGLIKALERVVERIEVCLWWLILD